MESLHRAPQAAGARGGAPRQLGPGVVLPGGWDWVGMCPHHPSGLSKDSGFVPGNESTVIFKDNEMLR